VYVCMYISNAVTYVMLVRLWPYDPPPHLLLRSRDRSGEAKEWILGVCEACWGSVPLAPRVETRRRMISGPSCTARDLVLHKRFCT
jgi:hypothetical protein